MAGRQSYHTLPYRKLRFGAVSLKNKVDKGYAIINLKTVGFCSYAPAGPRSHVDPLNHDRVVAELKNLTSRHRDFEEGIGGPFTEEGPPEKIETQDEGGSFLRQQS